MRFQPIGILNHLDSAIDVDGDIVPCRHHPAAVLLRGVPGRSNVGVGPLEYHQRLQFPGHLAPHRIRPRHMPDEPAVRSRVCYQLKWNVVCRQSGRPDRHERTQRMRHDQRLDRRDLRLLEVLGDVHGSCDSSFNFVSGFVATDEQPHWRNNGDAIRKSRVAQGIRVNTANGLTGKSRVFTLRATARLLSSAAHYGHAGVVTASTQRLADPAGCWGRCRP